MSPHTAHMVIVTLCWSWSINCYVGAVGNVSYRKKGKTPCPYCNFHKSWWDNRIFNIMHFKFVCITSYSYSKEFSRKIAWQCLLVFYWKLFVSRTIVDSVLEWQMEQLVFRIINDGMKIYRDKIRTSFGSTYTMKNRWCLYKFRKLKGFESKIKQVT